MPQAQEFMGEWVKFMRHLKGKLDRIDDRTEAIENLQTLTVPAIDDAAEAIDDVSDKLTLLMSETNITPELHSDVLQMASTDPRNASPRDTGERWTF
jgi:hypothetical protein